MPTHLFVTKCRVLNEPEFCEIIQECCTKISRVFYIFLKMGPVYHTLLNNINKFSPALTIIGAIWAISQGSRSLT